MTNLTLYTLSSLCQHLFCRSILKNFLQLPNLKNVFVDISGTSGRFMGCPTGLASREQAQSIPSNNEIMMERFLQPIQLKMINKNIPLSISFIFIKSLNRKNVLRLQIT